MPIPPGTKFHGVAPGVETENKGSSTRNAERDVYTIEEFGGGGGVQNLNNLNGNVTLTEGANITLDVITGSNEIEISAGGGGSTDGIDLSLIVRSNPYTTAGDHEGTVLSLFGLEILVLGTVYRWAGGSWSPADASATATATGLIGIATDDGAAADVLVSGIIRLASVPGSAGDVLYLNTTNGTLTNDVSAFTQGQIVRVMGYNLGGSRIYFNPSPDWIELA